VDKANYLYREAARKDRDLKHVIIITNVKGICGRGREERHAIPREGRSISQNERIPRGRLRGLLGSIFEGELTKTGSAAGAKKKRPKNKLELKLCSSGNLLFGMGTVQERRKKSSGL